MHRPCGHRARPLVVFGVALALLSTSCGTLAHLFTRDVAGDCVVLHCREGDAHAYQACESACRQAYP
ncbi:MAG: hypothetical protein KF894_00400 [Labilithrix sp.]|nr:hypothetical protein [Labilithrix sp.]